MSATADAIALEAPAAAPAWGAFRRVWSAHTVSTIGDHFTMLALPLAAYERTRSPLAVGAVAAMEAITAVLLGVVAGVFGDRLPRRPVLVVTDLVRGAVVGLLALAAVGASYHVAVLFSAAFVLGAMRVLHDAAAAAIVPLLVEPEDTLRANSRFHAADSAATAVGPALAGALVSVGGPAMAFAFDAVSFGVSGAMLGTVDGLTTPAGPQRRARVGREVRDGFRAIWQDDFVMRALVVVAALNIVATAAEGHFVPYAIQVLGLREGLVGAYFALGGAVAVVTATVAGRHRAVRGDAMVVGLAVFSLGFLAAGLAPSAWTAAVAFVAAGFGSAVTITHFYALRHKRFPVHLLGRVSMVTRVAIMGLVPVAYLAGGWFARDHGPDALYVAVSVLGLGAALWGVAAGLLRRRVD